MAAYDNVALPAAPNIATAGNYAQLLQQGLSQIPQEYWKGQQQRYEQRQRDLFQNPDNRDLLTRAISDVDPEVRNKAGNQLLEKIIQTGGVPAAQNYMHLLMNQQGQAIGEAAMGGGQPSSGRPATNGPAASNAAASPASITGQFQQQPSPTGNAGGESVRTLTAGIAAGRSIPDAAIGNFARALGVDPDEPLSAADEKRAKEQIIGPAISRMTNQAAGAPQRNPVPQSGLQDEGSANQNVPNGAAGGSSAISPRPTSASGNIGGAPAAGQTTTPAQAPSAINRLNVLQSLADRYEERGRNQIKASLNARVDKERAQGLRDAGNKDLDTAKQYRDEWFKAQGLEPTTEEKNARASGFANPLAYTQAQERLKLQAKRYDDLDSGIQATDRAASDSDKDMRAMRGILNDPKLFTMAGQEFVEYLRGAMINAHLMDPNERLPNEALKKITSKALQAQIAQMQDSAKEVGGSAGRIMLQQIRIMQDAAQNPDMSPSGLRYLTELMERANEHTHGIAQLARDYKKSHNDALDSGFDQRLADFEKEHANKFITDQEIEHHQLLSSPHLPEGVDQRGKEAVAKWARSQGLKPGDSIRVGDKYMPSP